MRYQPLPYAAGSRGRARGRRAQAGMTLIETLIAAGLLAFVAIAIFPLFHRALANNISGSDSNQATQHGRSQLEGLLARPFDSQVFSMSNKLPEHTIQSEGIGDRMTVEDLYWDPNDTAPGLPDDPTRHIASGSWISGTTSTGLIIWRRRTWIRQYAYADIGAGVIDVNDPTRIATQGHPQLFDVPLKRDAPSSQINFREEDVTLTSFRPGTPLFRARMMRTY